MTPERKQEIETRLYDYPEVKRRFRVMTREEYEWGLTLTQDLPTDSVASPVLSDMPHGTEVGNPTLRLVIQISEILRRRQAEFDKAFAARQEEFNNLLDELLLMEAIWVDFDAVERELINWRYWQSESQSHPPSYEWIAEQCQYEQTRKLRGMLVPADRERVSEALNRILGKIDKAWYGTKNGFRRNSAEIPQKFRRNSADTPESV